MLLAYVLCVQETELDQRKADRHSLLKTCKVHTWLFVLHTVCIWPLQHFSGTWSVQMEEIEIPMVRGSMDDIGDEEVYRQRDVCSC